MGNAERLGWFHDRHAGITSRVMARGRDETGRASYELLAELARPGERVLDLGCGDGYLLELLRARGAVAVGVDRSEAELALARRRGAIAVAGDAARLPFGDAAFTLVVSHLALSIMDDFDAVAAELDRVLARPGRLAAVVGGGPVATPPGETNTFEAFLTLLGEALGAAPRCRFGDPRATREAGWREVLGARGFAIEWSRRCVDLSGPLPEVWLALSTGYDCAILLSAAARAELRGAFTAWCRERFPLGEVPLHMVVWLAVARRLER
jgi:SAM-dependent methyltransferase